MRLFLGVLGLGLALGSSVACGGDDDDDDDSSAIFHDDCPAVCTAAQAASCTVVDCNCSEFCSSLEAFKSKGGCDATATAYENCAMRQDACSVSPNCSSEENAFVSCVTQYCVSNQTDSDCIFLQTC